MKEKNKIFWNWFVGLNPFLQILVTSVLGLPLALSINYFGIVKGFIIGFILTIPIIVSKLYSGTLKK
jgi:hypothetical protein